MSARCGVCSKFSSAKSDIPCSGVCKRIMHMKCILSAYGIQQREIEVPGFSFWCDVCRPGASAQGSSRALASSDSSRISKGAEGGPSVVEARPDSAGLSLCDLMRAIESCSAKLTTLTRFVETQDATNKRVEQKLNMLPVMQREMRDFVDELKGVKKELKDVTGRVDEVVSRNVELAGRCTQLEAENKEVRARVAHLERRACGSELVIAGVAELPGEDLSAAVLAVGRALGVGVQRSDIRDVARLGKMSSGSDRPRSILVELSSRLLCREYIEMKRKKGTLIASEVMHGLGSGRVYVNESLSSGVRKLYAETRAFVGAEGWLKAFVRGGTVFALKEAGARPMRVRCLEDLRGSD